MSVGVDLCQCIRTDRSYDSKPKRMQVKVVELLIAKGCRRSIRIDEDLERPLLCWQAEKDTVEVVKLLVEKGAEVDFVNILRTDRSYACKPKRTGKGCGAAH